MPLKIKRLVYSGSNLTENSQSYGAAKVKGRGSSYGNAFWSFCNLNSGAVEIHVQRVLCVGQRVANWVRK